MPTLTEYRLTETELTELRLRRQAHDTAKTLAWMAQESLQAWLAALKAKYRVEGAEVEIQLSTGRLIVQPSGGHADGGPDAAPPAGG